MGGVYRIQTLFGFYFIFIFTWPLSQASKPVNSALSALAQFAQLPAKQLKINA